VRKNSEETHYYALQPDLDGLKMQENRICVGLRSNWKKGRAANLSQEESKRANPLNDLRSALVVTQTPTDRTNHPEKSRKAKKLDGKKQAGGDRSVTVRRTDHRCL